MADSLRDLRLLALRAVLKPTKDPEYNLRRIFRWYSRTFNTPLHVVADLPLDDILQNYYEVTYEDLVSEAETKSPQFLDIEIAELTETDADKIIRHRHEAEDELDNAKFMAKVEEGERKKKAKEARKFTGLDEPMDNKGLIPSEASFIVPNEEFKSSITAQTERRSLPASTLPSAITSRVVKGPDGRPIEPVFKSEEDVKVIRMSEADFAKMIEEDPVRTPKKS